MQLTNGAIKVGVQPPPMNPTSVEEYEGVDLDTFDLSAFAKPAKVRTASAAGTDVLSNNPEVQKFLTEGAELFKLGERYEVEIVQRGHNALYELLASIYDFSMRIENSSFKEKILTEIRKDLKDNHSITLKSNTPAINTMVKYMVRSDKVTASRYLKVLTVAQKENLPAADLPAYIARRGGVSQIQDVESAALAKGTGDKNNKERTSLIREYYELVGKASKMDFDFDGDVCVYAEEKEGKTEESSFCVFVAVHVGGSKFKMVSANELGKAYEDNLVKFIGKTLPNDLTVLEHGVRNLKKQISMDKSQPESLRKEMQVQLAIPLKHKQVEVIDMDTSDDAPL